MNHLVVSWERPFFVINEQPIIPIIYDGTFVDSIPSEFNIVKIVLDGRMESDLNWKEADQIAQKVIAQGKLIFWELELGLFVDLPLSLSDQSQYLALGLSIDYFLETLWKKYGANTFGVCLYRGSGQFGFSFPWNDEHQCQLREWLKTHQMQIEKSSFHDLMHPEGRLLLDLYGRDLIGSYLSLLANKLPDALESFVLFDVEGIASPMHQMLMLHQECFSRLHLGVKGSRYFFQGLSWDDPSSSGVITNKPPRLIDLPVVSIGICLPSADAIQFQQYTIFERSVNWLHKHKLLYRPILEENLTIDWDGLDYLFVLPETLSDQGLRKLKGFCAAGGTVVNLGEPLRLDLEIPFNNFEYEYFNSKTVL